MKTFRFDTETFPIRAGLLAPKLVCVQYAIDDDVKGLNGDVRIVLRDDPGTKAVIEACLDDDNVLFEAFNGAYDIVEIIATWPDLIGKVFRMLARGRGRDPMLREMLLEIRAGTLQDKHPQGHFSLGGIAKRRVGVEMDKGEETWRTRYALLDGIDPSRWPEEARQYAVDDVRYLRDVARSQARDGATPDEWLQVAAAVCLQLAALHGARTDEWTLSWAEMCCLAEAEFCEDVLTKAGLFTAEGTVNTAKVHEAVVAACVAAKIEVPLTPGKKPKADADTLEMLAPHNEALTVLSRLNTARKWKSTYIEPMQSGIRHAMTSRPNVLVASGRTSWGGSKLKQANPFWPELEDGLKYEVVEERAGTNFQNFPKAYGIREGVVPRDGFHLASVDYGALELRTLGQACLWIAGDSAFADGFRKDPNWDPHSDYGGEVVGISYEEAIKRKKTDAAFKKGPRAIGKALNFSLPGGVGARRFADMTVDLYKAGELPAPLTVQECYEHKERWNEKFRMAPFFEFVSYHSDTGTPLTQFVSNRVRGCNGRNDYTSLANSIFQGLAGDLAKRALFYITMSCYAVPDSPLFGSRLLFFIHDEFILEVPVDNAHEATMEVVRLMVLAANEVCPDVPFTAEPALMTHWTKEAEPVYVDGKLVPWA
jgi:hypothetical protein